MSSVGSLGPVGLLDHRCCQLVFYVTRRMTSQNSVVDARTYLTIAHPQQELRLQVAGSRDSRASLLEFR